MADPRWGYDPRIHRYRDLTTGRFLPAKTVVTIRDRVTDAAGAQAREVAAAAARGEISTAAFRESMRTAIRNSHTANYVFGRGGLNAMTPADFGRIGGDLRTQYKFLEGFVADLEAGTLSEKQAAARAAMYINGATRAFEEGQAASHGVNDALPLMPGDNCEGFSNCRCSWEYEDAGAELHAFWTLGGDDPCSPCQQNAAQYAPWVIHKSVAVADDEPVRFAAVPGAREVFAAWR